MAEVVASFQSKQIRTDELERMLTEIETMTEDEALLALNAATNAQHGSPDLKARLGALSPAKHALHEKKLKP